jgi:hypothetical protein
VDAICINQSSTEEIDRQLPLMRSIFSQAKRTIVWLGPEDNESVKAFELLKRLFKKQEGTESSEVDQVQNEAIIGQNPGTPLTWADEGELVALHYLFTRPYFFRVWVVQEIATSSEVVVCCGQSRLPWNVFFWAARFMDRSLAIEPIIHKCLKSKPSYGSKTYKPLHMGVQRICSINSVRADVIESERSHDKPRDSLLYLLESHRITEATKPNDKYLALAGLVEEDSSITLRKSCRSSIAETYILAAESIAKQNSHQGALGFLDFAGWPTNPQYREELPSWAPDWSYSKARSIPLLYWQLAGQKHKDFVEINAPGQTNSCHADSYSFNREEKCLVARGVILGAVNSVGYSRWSCGENPDVQNGKISAKGPHQYPSSNELLSDVIWKTFVLNITHLDGLRAPQEWGDLFYQHLFCPDNSSHPSHTLWYEQNKHFVMYGTSLEEIAKEQRKLRSLAAVDGNYAANESLRRKLEPLMASFNAAVHYRRLATTGSGYVCLAPSTSNIGDIVVILFDCHVPVVLRRESGESRLKFIGSCYVHGIMQGELSEWLSGQKSEQFNIR